MEAGMLDVGTENNNCSRTSKLHLDARWSIRQAILYIIIFPLLLLLMLLHYQEYQAHRCHWRYHRKYLVVLVLLHALAAATNTNQCIMVFYHLDTSLLLVLILLLLVVVNIFLLPPTIFKSRIPAGCISIHTRADHGPVFHTAKNGHSRVVQAQG